MGSQQLYSLSWGEFGTSLTSTVQVLRGHGEMVDVTLAAGGRIFPAHKLVLSAASPLLMELLKSTHCHHPVVMLAGITAPDLEALLQFVYQGEVSVDPNQLPSLLQAAHCLDIQALSPQTLTTEKTMAQISVPVVMDNGLRDINTAPLPPMSRDMSSPLLPVRKRKRKQQRTSESDSVKWAVSEGVGGVVVEGRPPMEQVVDNSLVANPVDEPLKDEILDDQHCNGEPLVPPHESKLRCASEQPRVCPLCGLLIRQARNLRRHLLTSCASRQASELTPDQADYLECQVSTPEQYSPDQYNQNPAPAPFMMNQPNELTQNSVGTATTQDLHEMTQSTEYRTLEDNVKQ